MNASVTIILSALLLIGCSDPETSKGPDVPQKLNDGWDVASVREVGMDPEKIENGLNINNPKLDAILVVKDGKLVAERYFNGYAVDKQHKIWSITKAITATVVGIAIDKGDITSEQDSAYRYLGNYTISQPSVKEITIAHLLSMSSGFAWKELGGPGSANFEMPYQNDWITYMLQQSHTHPGKDFLYNTGSYMLFGPIIKNATGNQVSEYANAHLFAPLNISNYQWDKQSEFWTKTDGHELKGAREPGEIKYNEEFAAYSNTGSGLHMLPRDMAKIGQLYLDKGKWNGKLIVSEEWIKKATAEKIPGSNYGYAWRQRTYEHNGSKYDAWHASGFGQQAIILIPSLQMVIVYAQHHYDSMPEGERIMNEQMSQFISACVK